jgi:SAM-dependent methyltransferase
MCPSTDELGREAVWVFATELHILAGMSGMTEPTEFYHDAYEGKLPFRDRLPWDIGGPQPAIAAIADSGAVDGDVLDIGCGTGENTLYFAARGHSVTGVDISPVAVARARERAAQLAIAAEFAVGDALDLSAYHARFGTVVDCGLFHSLTADTRPLFTRQLHAVCRPGGRVHVLANGQEGQQAVMGRLGVQALERMRRLLAPLTQEQFLDAFAEGWTVVSVRDVPLMAQFPGEPEPKAIPAWLGTFVRVD